MKWDGWVSWSCRLQGNASRRTPGVPRQQSGLSGLALSSDPRDPCQIKGSSLEPGHQKAKADLWIKLVKLAWSCELISSWEWYEGRRTCALFTAAGLKVAERVSGLPGRVPLQRCWHVQAESCGKRSLGASWQPVTRRPEDAKQLMLLRMQRPLLPGRNAPAANAVKFKTFTIMLRCEGGSRGLLGHGFPRGEQVITTEAG